MTLKTMAPLALVLLSACSATTEKPPAPITVEQQITKLETAYNSAAKDEDDQVVCRNEAVTGSRIAQPVCRTKRSMTEDEESAERMMRKPPHYPTQGQ